MSKLIIVCGLPGSGKTTLARALSKKLNIVCLHKDLIKESLYEAMNGETLEDSKRIGGYTAQIMLKIPEEYLSNGVDLILESPFNFSGDEKVFESWQDKYGAQIYSVICNINEDERELRYRNRERHRAHHDDKREVRVDEYNYDVMPGKKIKIVSDKPVDEIVEDVLKEIK